MTIIVGLGNPGEKYAHSRHNMGWRVVESIQRALHSGQWVVDKASEAEVFEIGDAVLVKPHTFMNLSGTAVKAIMKKHDFAALGKKDFHNLFVIYDDLDLEVGKSKLVFGSGPKVHNGVNHIKDTLGTDQFWHIRIGVDGRKGDRSQDPQDYVLGGFSPDEEELVNKVIDSIVDLLKQKIEATLAS